MTVLVLGFGAFGAVNDNPSARLARALDGTVVGSMRIVGEEMPVSYRRSLTFTRARVNAVRPDFVLGIGVAVDRADAKIEEQAVNRVMAGRPDVDGRVPARLGRGPRLLVCEAAPRLAAAMGLALSPDAGTYVCNAWLYRSIRAGWRCAFLHVPAEGMAAERVLAGLGRFAERMKGGESWPKAE